MDDVGHIAVQAPIEPRQRSGRIWLLGTIVLIAAITAAVLGIMSRRQSQAELQVRTDAAAVPLVRVIVPTRGPVSSELVLPGDVEAYFTAPIYARVSGYLKSWHHDIGARVKAGDVLADIDAPELDQQLAQARANLASARANEDLANLTARRWHSLRSSDAVSQQTADEKTGDAAAKHAAVVAAEAEVARLAALENFKRITAPFDGVVTARETDIGALIAAGSSSGPVLFSVADTHAMRIYVRVPQAYAPALSPGLSATLRLPQQTGASHTARLVTTSAAVARESRTILAELQADNADGALLPGTFAEVHIELRSNGDVLRVPSSALIFREHGLELAVLGPHNTALLKPVQAGRDFGAEIEILGGLAPGDQVIESPPDSIATGDAVRLAPAAGQVATAKPAGPPAP
jgi:RND family efflux transporter MFP subunit